MNTRHKSYSVRRALLLLLVSAGTILSGGCIAQRWDLYQLPQYVEGEPDDLSEGNRMYGLLGRLGGWDAYLSFIAFYGFHSQQASRDWNHPEYGVLISFRQRADSASDFVCEKLILTALPSGKREVVPCKVNAPDKGRYLPQPRHNIRFQDVTLPEGTDSLRLEFDVSWLGMGADSTREERHFDLMLHRYAETFQTPAWLVD